MLLLALSVGFAPSPTVQDDGWRFRLTPYLWAPSIDGSMTIDGEGGDVEEESGSALDYLSGAAMLAVEARRGEWSLLGDVVWARFNVEGTLDNAPGVAFEGENNELIVGFGAARTLLRGERGRLDGVFGVRYLHADLSVDPQGAIAQEHSGEKDLVDPFFGVRGRYGEDRGLFADAYGDIGGFGVSADLTWQFMAGVGWAWSWGDVRLGWREIAYDFDSGGVLYDLAASGPFLSVTFNL